MRMPRDYNDEETRPLSLIPYEDSSTTGAGHMYVVVDAVSPSVKANLQPMSNTIF